MAVKNCARCKKPFSCCNERPGCWCETLTVDSDALGLLQTEFDNCLCPDCLVLYAVKKEDTGINM
jgi:hypothetical protein